MSDYERAAKRIADVAWETGAYIEYIKIVPAKIAAILREEFPERDERNYFNRSLDLYTALVDFAPDVRNIPKIQRIMELARKTRPAPDVAVRDAIGRELAMSDLRMEIINRCVSAATDWHTRVYLRDKGARQSLMAAVSDAGERGLSNVELKQSAYLAFFTHLAENPAPNVTALQEELSVVKAELAGVQALYDEACNVIGKRMIADASAPDVTARRIYYEILCFIERKTATEIIAEIAAFLRSEPKGKNEIHPANQGKEEAMERLQETLIAEIEKELAKDSVNLGFLDVLNRLLGTVASYLLTKK